jgi:hypothetical protein
MRMYQELNFSQIKAAGWVKEYLNTQATGLTGHLGQIGHPFTSPSWDATPEQAESALEHFIGGLNSKNDAWVPFEQTGYWIDGAIRAGHLADNEELLKLGKSKIYSAIENAQDNGFIGPKYLEGGLTWPHAVYFRALMAEYTATGNREILEPCGEYFRLNHRDADAETLDFIDLIQSHPEKILAVLAGHLHFTCNSEIAPGIPQYVSSQGILGNINRYEIGV